MMTLDEMIDAAGKHARHVLIDHGQRGLIPTFLWVDGQGRITIAGVAVDFDDASQKDAAADAIRQKMRDDGAVAYSFLSEAWLATRPANAPMPSNVRDLPNKIEVVHAIAHDAKGGSRSHGWRMERDAKGAVTDLVDLGASSPNLIGGRFANLLETLQ